MDYKFGLTKVFFRTGKFSEFDQVLFLFIKKLNKTFKLMKDDPENMKKSIEKIKTWILRLRWRKAQYGVWSCIKRNYFKIL